MTTAAVVGLGKIGLPLATQMVTRGVTVIGVDRLQPTVELVNAGVPPFPGEPDLERLLRRAVQEGAFRATTDTGEVGRAEVVVIVVPLVVGADHTPDFGAIDAATAAVAAAISAGTLVVYETTLPVGATRTRFTPMLAEGSGLTPGADLFVAHSPERVSSGRVFADLKRYPKLVGGIDAESERRAVEFYDAILEFDDRPDLPRPNGVWALGGAEAAELAKLAETTYRDLNIAFANELSIAADGLGIDIGAVIAACNSQPYSHIHSPGVAVGGHCIPVYPHLLMSSVPGFRVPAVARQVNAAMPAYAVHRVTEALGGSLSGRTVAILGLAYRGGVKEDAFSGCYALRDAIVAGGGRAVVHDPMYDEAELEARGLLAYRLGDPCDAAIVHTDHAEYTTLSADDVPGALVVYDGRRVVDPAGWSGGMLVRLGAPSG